MPAARNNPKSCIPNMRRIQRTVLAISNIEICFALGKVFRTCRLHSP